MSIVNELMRRRVNYSNRKKLYNTNFSLLSNNCIGAFILHDLGLKFNSPFVNLWMKPGDYIKYLESLEYYKDLPLLFKKEKGEYPIGILEDLRIYFQHYASEDEAKIKWVERTKRINENNIFVLMTDRDGCTYKDLQKFDSLYQYQNKIVFTHKKYPEFKSAFYIPGFEKEGFVGECWKYKNKISSKKIYDNFPYVDWFNGNQID